MKLFTKLLYFRYVLFTLTKWTLAAHYQYFIINNTSNEQTNFRKRERGGEICGRFR